ncbi:hypothetical protein KIK06_15160 [Nocardiopsis sp. EMB25]|uniref:hypothetical protein n=1 Tax=Nocardiopsis sp. EMB25 TaxID=2835867 RepID=UPI0022846CC8|nr:hypothetical protein [Nocardiopsis sp. EMB25]MCY9785222.1 hypothetical protein [Nocardiopsis sp. EMB25]
MTASCSVYLYGTLPENVRLLAEWAPRLHDGTPVAVYIEPTDDRFAIGVDVDDVDTGLTVLAELRQVWQQARQVLGPGSLPLTQAVVEHEDSQQHWNAMDHWCQDKRLADLRADGFNGMTEASRRAQGS